MPSRESAGLQTNIRIVGEMMLTVHYYEEANWLSLAVTSPKSCTTERGRRVLRNAEVIARQFGFNDVAEWIQRQVLGGS